MTRVELAAGDDRITIDAAAGARLASAVLGGRERLVDAPPTHVAPPRADLRWGAFLMAPWAGRIRDGELRWADRTHRFSFPDGDHAMHGVVRDAPWTVVEAERDRALLQASLADQGWPLGGTVTHEARMASGRLDSVLTVTAGPSSMPAWVGWHPCFRRPDDGDMTVRLGAAVVLETEDAIPTGATAPVAGDLDLREGPVLGDRRLDHAFVDVDGPAVVGWPDLRLTMDVDGGSTWVVFTPPTEVCVEPQTGWPDALRLHQEGVPGTGLRVLAPGEVLRATMTWRWTTPDE